MECLRSFIISLKGTSTFTGADVKTWTSGGETFWVTEVNGTSTYTFQGFKNIDVYGVDVIGSVVSDKTTPTGGVNVNDWSFTIFIDGQLPLVSGLDTIGPNFWVIQENAPNTKTFYLSKNTNSIKLLSPIKSSPFIRFDKLQAQGVGGETSGTTSLKYDFNFIVYYKYEGE